MIEKHLGKLSKGCELCFKGKKLVLFITGICPRNCIYCPLSEAKKNKDVIYANEVRVSKINQLLEEAKLSNAKGAGITGGDPLSKLNRTTLYIKTLKKKFGKKFHIHLYTSLDLITKNSVRKLQESGLDELRIHINIEDRNSWKKLPLIKGKFQETGIEIPVIPGKEKEIIEMINYCKDFVDFFNLNELEYATLKEKEYKTKKWIVRASYEVENSEETALKILNHFKNQKIRIHYCSAEFKDKVQFCERIKVRAKSVANFLDIITDEGTLLKAVIYPEKENLISLKKKLQKNFPKIKFIQDKNRIQAQFDSIKQISKKFKNCAIVEEYPTKDKLEVYVEFLS